MAKNNFNFQVKAGLDVKNFNKGVSSLQKSLNKLKGAFTTFAGGIGLAMGFDKLVSSVKDTTLRLDTALNTLKNVSNVTKIAKTETGELDVTISNYGSNLAYVKKLSNEYGQDMIALIDNFAKFTAASKGTSLGLEDQRLVFESLTRASAAYHLSADKTADVMNAVVQMMSKGKVVAEELRRQLGNNLPGAFNIMAAAMGVSTSQLDKMMSNGELMAAEVLPRFAEQLNNLTANANFDSLQNSINKFKNEWYELVEISNSDELFKTIVDKSASALGHVGDNFQSYLGGALGLLLSLLSGPPVAKAFQKAGNYFKNYRANVQKELNIVNNSIKGIRKALGVNLGDFDSVSLLDVARGDQNGSVDLNSMLEHNKLIEKKISLYDELGISIKETLGEDFKKTLSSNNQSIKSAIKEQNKYINTLNPNIWTRFKIGAISAGKGIGKVFKNIGKTIYGMLGPIGLITIAISAISTAVGAWLGKQKQIREEMERIANITEGRKGRIDEYVAPANEEIKKANQLLDEFNKSLKAGDEKKMRLIYGELQKIVPSLQDLTYDDLKKKADGFDLMTDKISNWSSALKSGTEYMGLLAEERDLIERKEELEGFIKTLKESGKELTKTKAIRTGSGMFGGQTTTYEKVPTEEGEKLKKWEEELSQINKALEQNTKDIEELDVTLEDAFEEPDSPIVELFKESQEELKKLKRQFDEGAISIKEYEDELDSYAKKYYKEAIGNSNFIVEDIKKKLADGGSLSALEKWYLNLNEMVTKAMAREGERQAEEQAEKLAEKIKEEQEKFKKDFANGKYEVESVPDRSTKLDYKKSGLEITTESYDVVEERVEKLSSALEEMREEYAKGFEKGGFEEAENKMKEMEADLNALIAASKTWQEVMTLEEMVQDIQNLEKELKELHLNMAEEIWFDTSGLINSVDSIVSAFERLNDVAKDDKSTVWKKFMASFQVFESIMNGVIGTMTALNTIMELSNSIKDAQTLKQNQLNAAKSQGVAIETAAAAATTAAAGASTAAATAAAGEATAAAANTAAKSGEAIANATASGAKVPFPYNILAIAAGVAAVVAALASISKFEKGGIVGGSSTHGDKNIVRANSGEMVLTKSQQGTLFKAIQSGNLGGGSGEWKVRGTDLIKVINNTQSRMKG